MKLSELEERARQEREEQAALAAKEQLEKQIAEAEAAEAFRQEVITWMFQEAGLEATELEATLIVESHKNGTVRLRVPDHTDIAFRVVLKDGAYSVYNGAFEVERHNNYARYVGSLSDALLIAAEEWQEGVQKDAEEEQREAERQAKHELREREAAERGTKYLNLLNDHPILRPMLHILSMVLEEREGFAEDLYRAEEFYAGVEARYEEKLGQAQYETQRAERERDDLQRDLWNELEMARERKSKRGW